MRRRGNVGSSAAGGASTPPSPQPAPSTGPKLALVSNASFSSSFSFSFRSQHLVKDEIILSNHKILPDKKTGIYIIHICYLFKVSNYIMPCFFQVQVKYSDSREFLISFYRWNTYFIRFRSRLLRLLIIYVINVARWSSIVILQGCLKFLKLTPRGEWFPTS